MPFYLSYSKVREYLGCPYKYYLHIIRKVEIPTAPWYVVGKAVHQGLEHNYVQKILTWEDLPEDVPLDVYSDTFEELAYQVEFKDEGKGETKDSGYSVLQIYYRQNVPLLFPQEQGVESKFIIQITPEILFSGRIDLITREENILDVKVTTRTPSQAELARNYQVTAYSLGYRALKKKLPSGLYLDYLVRTKKPEVKPFKVERSEADITRFVETARQVARGIRAGIFPRNEDNFFCSESGCEYYRICKGEK